MRYLKLFENHFHEVISEAEVAKICDKYYIRNWTLNSDGTVDVDGSVNLGKIGLTELPLNFGRVDGNFSCNDNQLNSLKGCPQYVDGSFLCYGNRLTSLVGCPQYVGNRFDCENNMIRSFEGIGHIGGDFDCITNPIYCLWYLFINKSKIDTFNEWGVVQNDQVILYRLNDFLQEIGEDDITEHRLNDIKKYYTVL